MTTTTTTTTNSLKRGWAPGIEQVSSLWTGTSVTPLDRRPELITAIRSVIALQELPPNWNSYGARKISGTAISYAIQLLNLANEIPALPTALIPTNGGGVQLEWDYPGKEIEIEVHDDGTVDLFRRTAESESEDARIPIELITAAVLSALISPP